VRSVRRVGAVLALTGLPLLGVLMPVPAQAAGTGGIEVTPLTGGSADRPASAFHVRFPDSGQATAKFLLRNVTNKTVSGRLYAASAERDATGSFAIGSAGSSPYVDLPDRELTLRPGARQTLSFVIRSISGKQPTSERYAAIVVSVSRGTIVERAATLVYLAPATSGPPVISIAIAALAAGLVFGVGAAVVKVGRRAS